MAKRKAPDVKVEPPTPKKKAMAKAKAKAKASDGFAIPEATPSVASEAAAMEAPSTESKPAKAWNPTSQKRVLLQHFPSG